MPFKGGVLMKKEPKEDEREGRKNKVAWIMD
jgi:hypothetical protein